MLCTIIVQKNIIVDKHKDTKTLLLYKGKIKRVIRSAKLITLCPGFVKKFQFDPHPFHVR